MACVLDKQIVRVWNGIIYFRKWSIIGCLWTDSAVVPKACCAMGSATSSQGIRGYISVMATLKFTYFLIKGTIVIKNNEEYSLNLMFVWPCVIDIQWRGRPTRCNNYDLLIIHSLNMFRASLCPSSGALGCILLHMVFSTVKNKSS